MNLRARMRMDERGVSIVETLIALLILTTAVMALLTAAGWAGRATSTSRRDLQWWAALQWKADSLSGIDSAAVTAGNDVVNGYDVSWEVYPGTLTRVAVFTKGPSILNPRDSVGDTVMVYLGSAP